MNIEHCDVRCFLGISFLYRWRNKNWSNESRKNLSHVEKIIHMLILDSGLVSQSNKANRTGKASRWRVENKSDKKIKNRKTARQTVS